MTTQVNTSQVTAPNFLRRSENTFVRGIVPVIKKYDKPLQLFRPQNIKNKRGALDNSYDRLVILGEINSKECFAVIAESAQKSYFLFGDTLLTVGSIVDVQEPVFSNFCLGNDRSNPIFHVFLPLEVVVNNIPLLPIPIDLHPSTTAMFHFCLPNRPLTFLQACAVAPTCSGFMCDRREKRIDSVCPCIQKSPVSAWVMCARIVSRDIENEDEDSLTGEMIQSLNLTKLFCSEAIIRSSYASIDSQQLRNDVNQVSQFVNENGGWQVCGFYKSGSTDENLAQNVQRNRICKIMPAVEVPFNLKYSIVPCNANIGNEPPALQHANANVGAPNNPNNVQ